MFLAFLLNVLIYLVFHCVPPYCIKAWFLLDYSLLSFKFPQLIPEKTAKNKFYRTQVYFYHQNENESQLCKSHVYHLLKQYARSQLF